MAKYKQAVIPEVSTEEWVKLTSLELRNKAFEAYRARFFGKKVVNLALAISIGFEREGALLSGMSVVARNIAEPLTRQSQFEIQQ